MVVVVGEVVKVIGDDVGIVLVAVEVTAFLGVAVVMIVRFLKSSVDKSYHNHYQHTRH